MEWLWCRIWLYFNYIYFYTNLVYSKTTMSPWAHARVIPLYLWIMKDKLGNQRYQWPCWFLFTYILLIWIQSDWCLAQTNITCTWKMYFQVTTIPRKKLLSSPRNKVWQVVVASTKPWTIWPSATYL